MEQAPVQNVEDALVAQSALDVPESNAAADEPSPCLLGGELYEELQDILRTKPAWVSNVINRAIEEEVQRSFKRVASQIRCFKDILEEVASFNQSEDMTELKRVLRELRDPAIRALERDADKISEYMRKVCLCLALQDFKSLAAYAENVKSVAERFNNKFASLSESLDRMARVIDGLRGKARMGNEEANELLRKAEERRDSWMHWIDGVPTPCLGLGLAAASLVVVGATLTLAPPHIALFCVMWAYASLSTMCTSVDTRFARHMGNWTVTVSLLHGAACAAATCTTASVCGIGAPFALTLSASLVLGLAKLGVKGREVLKHLLAKVWECEIERHQATKDFFVRLDAELEQRLANLRSAADASQDVAEALDLVRDLAKGIAEGAGDANGLASAAATDELDGQGQVARSGLVKEIGLLREQLNELAGQVAKLPQALTSFFQTAAVVEKQWSMGVSSSLHDVDQQALVEEAHGGPRAPLPVSTEDASAAEAAGELVVEAGGPPLPLSRGSGSRGQGWNRTSLQVVHPEGRYGWSTAGRGL